MNEFGISDLSSEFFRAENKEDNVELGRLAEQFLTSTETEVQALEARIDQVRSASMPEKFKFRAEAAYLLIQMEWRRATFQKLGQDTFARFGELVRRFEKCRQEFDRDIEAYMEGIRGRIRDRSMMPEDFRAECAQYSGQTLEEFVDELLHTRKRVKTAKELDWGMIPYAPTPANIVVDQIANPELINQRMTVDDLGSGMGRTALLIRLLTGAHVRAIEYDPALSRFAEEQAQGLNLDGIEFITGDAREQDYRGTDAVYMFNPFGGPVMDTVLERLREAAKQRPLTVISLGASGGPVSRQHDWLRWENWNRKSGQVDVFRSLPPNQIG